MRTLQRWIVFSVLYMCFHPLLAEADSIFDIAYQTPLNIETHAGQVVTVSLLIKNSDSLPAAYRLTFQYPEEWSFLSGSQTSLCLNPGESSVHLAAFRPPLSCAAGDYLIRCHSVSEENPSHCKDIECVVHICSHAAFDSQVENVPLFVSAGESYQARLYLANQGNVPLLLYIEACDLEGYLIDVTEKHIFLRPNETQNVIVSVETDPFVKQTFKHLLQLSVASCEYPLDAQHHSTFVEIFPMIEPPCVPFCFLPAQTTLGYGMKQGRKQMFIETSGAGALDVLQAKNIDFYFRLPLMQQAEVERDFGGFPGRGYVHYLEPRWDLFLGDGLFTLSPLTLLNSFGRGASINVYFPYFETGALYLKNNSSLPSTQTGGYLSVIPSSCFQCQASALQIHFSSHTAQILQVESESSIFAMKTAFEKACTGTEVEVAFDKNSLHNKAKSAFLLTSEGRPFNSCAYALQLIRAERQFTGYYRDLDQKNASLSLPFWQHLRGYGSVNYLKTNLEKNVEKHAATKSSYATCGLSYSFAWGTYASLGYNWVKSHNFLSQQGYETHYANLLLSQTWGRWIFQGQLEEGYYKTANKGMQEYLQTQSRHWKNVQAYLYCSLFSRLRFSLYSKIGFVTCQSLVDWQNTYGCSAWLQFTPWIYGECLYERTHFHTSAEIQYFSGGLNTTLPNGHQWGGRGFLRRALDGHTVYEFLLTYTIPWNLPMGRDRRFSAIKGRILNSATSSSITRMVINCNGCRTLTNTHGEFCFPSLEPGNYSLWLEDLPENLVPCSPLVQNIQLQGGKIAQIDIPIVTSSQVSGAIFLYKFDMQGDFLAEEEGILQEEAADHQLCYKKVQGWEHALVRLYSYDYNILLEQSTDWQGHFCFDKLPPGKWKITLVVTDMPAYYTLTQKEFDFELSEKQNAYYEFRMLPNARKLKMVDKGSL